MRYRYALLSHLGLHSFISNHSVNPLPNLSSRHSHLQGALYFQSVSVALPRLLCISYNTNLSYILIVHVLHVFNSPLALHSYSLPHGCARPNYHTIVWLGAYAMSANLSVFISIITRICSRKSPTRSCQVFLHFIPASSPVIFVYYGYLSATSISSSISLPIQPSLFMFPIALRQFIICT